MSDLLTPKNIPIVEKTSAERYAEGTPLPPGQVRKSNPTARPADSLVSTEVGDGPSLATTAAYDTVTLKLDLGDANAILQSKVAINESPPKKRTLPACFCSPCIKCRNNSNGILKGIRKSFPKKKHLVHYFKKTVNDRIDKNKNCVVVDAFPELNITYKSLDEISNAIASYLRETKFSQPYENLNPDGHLVIAVFLPVCYEYLVLLITVLKLGAAFLPLNPDLPLERLAEIVKLTRPVLIIMGNATEPILDELFTLVQFESARVEELWEVVYYSEWLDKSKVAFKNPIESLDPKKPLPPMWKRPVAISVIPSDSQDLQAVVYDSTAFFNKLAWEDYVFPYITSEHCLMPAAFDNIDSLADVITQLLVGITLVCIRSPLDYSIPELLFLYCEKYKVRRLTLWPSLLKACTITLRLFDEFVPMVNSVRFWFSIGGSIRSELADMFFELPIHPLAQLIHMYHFEDCVGALAFQIFESLGSSNQSFHSRLPVGSPVPNTDIYLLGPDMMPVKDGEVGEIYVCGMQSPLVADLSNLPNACYMVNPFSRKKKRQLLLRTLDVGRIMTKSNGTRVLVHELTRDKHYYVDNQLVWLLHLDTYLARLSNLVKQFHTLCYRPNEDDQTLIAFCVLTDSKVKVKDVENELKECLPAIMIPEVVNVKEIPLLPEGNQPDDTALLKSYQDRRHKRQKFNKWDSLGIDNPFQLHAAKILAYVINTVLGIAVSETVGPSWSKPFLQLSRATNTKGVFIVRELHLNRYPIYSDELVYCSSLSEVPELIVNARRARGFCNRNCPPDEVSFIKNRYKLEIMVNSSRYSVCSTLAKCFTQRDQLDYFAEVEYSQMRKFFDSTWPIFVEKKLSLIIRKKKDRNWLVGAVLNMNWHDEIQLTKSPVPKDIAYKLELIQYLESSLTDSHFPMDKTHVLQICYIGLDASALTPYEIHGLTDKVIRSMLIIAKVKGFEALVIITYDYFSMDICVNTYNFNVVKECQVNQFVASDGTRPYALCPDTTFATLCWKHLNKVQKADYRRQPNYGPGPSSAPPPPAVTPSETKTKPTNTTTAAAPAAAVPATAVPPTLAQETKRRSSANPNDPVLTLPGVSQLPTVQESKVDLSKAGSPDATKSPAAQQPGSSKDRKVSIAPAKKSPSANAKNTTPPVTKKGSPPK